MTLEIQLINCQIYYYCTKITSISLSIVILIELSSFRDFLQLSRSISRSWLKCFKSTSNLIFVLYGVLFRAVARSEIPGGLVVLGGDNVSPLVKIGLADLPNIGGAKAPPAPTLRRPWITYVVTCIQDGSQAGLVAPRVVNHPCLKCMVVPPQEQCFPKIADIYLV